MKTKWKKFLPCISFSFTLIIIFLLFIIKDYAPFGENSLACMDANIQYLDFFSYLKDVMSGNNNIIYTFSKVLGGTNIGTFSYYLSSPFNLLIIFFEKKDLHTFFDLIVLLKLSTAAATFSFFIIKRFEKNLNDITIFKYCTVVILSVSYALSQYSIAQSSNIMWLDGVYMLPLVLLGVYYIVQGKSSFLLSISVMLSTIFNWYMSGINCLFSIIWLFFEVFCQIAEENNINDKLSLKKFFNVLKKYLYSMILGVCGSAVLFLPTIYALKNSSRGSLSLDVLKNFSMFGWIPSVIQSYSFGSTSSYGNVSLYCGCFPIIGFISCFFTKGISKKTKRVFACMSLLTVMLFYCNFFFELFSLLQHAYSYYYRYSHVGIIVILFIAAYFYTSNISHNNRGEFLKSSLCFCLLQFILEDQSKPIENKQLIIYTLIFAVIISLMEICYIKFKKYKLPVMICIICLTVSDISYNTSLLMDKYHTSDVKTFVAYETGAEEQIKKIKEYDDGFYRITQTDTRNIDSNRCTAYYNEALAYNYNSISGYTSSPDDIQNNFLDKLGYRINSPCMCITNTSIIPADSLMGIKYVISSLDINGLEKIENIDMINGKYVYKNPYALPVAFIYENTDYNYGEVKNPFEFQNSIYSALIGKKVDLYKELNFSIIQNGDMSTNTPLIYSIEIPDGNFSVYANILWNSEMSSIVNVNNAYNTLYSCWLSPSVFNIPVNNNEKQAIIEVKSDISYDVKYGEEQFYALNLDILKEITDTLVNNVPDTVEIENEHVHINVNGHENQKLYLAIPYDKGWTVYNNGDEISPDLLGDCMYSIPLSEGNNDIEMVYNCRGLTLGVFISIISLILIILMKHGKLTAIVNKGFIVFIKKNFKNQ